LGSQKHELLRLYHVSPLFKSTFPGRESDVHIKGS